MNTEEKKAAAIERAIALVEAEGYVVRKRSAQAPRDTDVKADPIEVAAFFAATGLNRKEIAAAVGVSVSVIATVQNPKGDRWSQKRFELAQPLIMAAVEAKAAATAAVVETVETVAA